MSKSGSNIDRRQVVTSKLRPHPVAQRQLVRATVRKIRKRLDLDGIGTLTAVEYAIDGKKALWIVDGQTRWTALMEEGLGDWVVSVDVHTDVKDDARAAELFLVLNTRAPVSAYDTFLNELTAKDPIAVGVDKVVAKHGLQITRSANGGTLGCVSALKSLYAKDGGSALTATLTTLIAAWGRDHGALEGKVVEGLGMVLSHYNGQVDRPVLVKKLAKHPGGAFGILGNAKMLKGIVSASLGRCVANTIIEVYNKSRRAGQLDPI